MSSEPSDVMALHARSSTTSLVRCARSLGSAPSMPLPESMSFETLVQAASEPGSIEAPSLPPPSSVKSVRSDMERSACGRRRSGLRLRLQRSSCSSSINSSGTSVRRLYEQSSSVRRRRRASDAGSDSRRFS